MYFILSKVLLFILSPILWVFVLLLTAIIAKNSQRKKRLFIAAVVVFYIMSNHFLLNQFARLWNISSGPTTHNTYSCVIVLGGFSSEGKDGKGFFNESGDRFIQGLKLLAAGRATHILITGGNGELIPGKFREGDWVKTQLKEFKIPDSSILIEDRSRNTIENAVYSKVILQKAHLKPPYLLVTSAFHMRRAQMIFKNKGYQADVYPCNFIYGTSRASFNDLVPDAMALAGWNMYLKEVVGYAVD